MSSYVLHVGDCLALLAEMQPDTFDACITDPPYELAFMSKAWDKRGISFDPETWRAVYRVLKPGARLLAFGAPRTHHRIWCAIEDAGFVIEDTVMWLFGQGFPKHRSKLKPAHEPICVARKGPVTALNIDAARIGENAGWSYPNGPGGSDPHHMKRGEARGLGDIPVSATAGRWPANVALDDESARALDAMSGELVDGVAVHRNRDESNSHNPHGTFIGGWRNLARPDFGYGGSGGASRFFYTSKASRAERNAELAGRANGHATVKPVDLMCWLVRLVTQPGDSVLDPFAGSGTTGVACMMEGRAFVGCEIEPDYAAIAERRIKAAPLSLFAGGA